MTARLKQYNAAIQWDGTALDPSITGVVTLPDDSTRTIHRINESKEVQVTNSPFAYGGTHYLLDAPTGSARFETFDDLMQKGLGLVKE